jgi:peptidoglycan hydrolase CwlO-like protein
MKYNLALSAAFVRFLTKVTGRNAAAGVAGSIALLDAKLKNLDSTLKEVKKEAAATSARVTTANNSADSVKGKITKLYQLNMTLKK